MVARSPNVDLNDPQLLPRFSSADAEHIQQHAPAELLSAPIWVCGSREPKEHADGTVKSSKRPISPVTGGPGKSNDPRTWGTFEQACERALSMNENVGGYGICAIGVNLLGGQWVGLDLDHVLNRETGQLEPEARALLDTLPPTYTEVSPSRDGLRLFYRGKLPEAFRRSVVADAFGEGSQLECYDGQRGARYLTVTGRVFEGRGEMVDASEEQLQPLVDLQQQRSAVGAVLRKFGGTIESSTPVAPVEDEQQELEPPSSNGEHRIGNLSGKLDWLKTTKPAAAPERDDDHEHDLERARWGLLEAQLLDPDAGYGDPNDGWLRVLAALRCLGEDGLRLAIEWSRRGDKFVEGDIEKKWPGLRGSSAGSLFGMFDDMSATWRNDFKMARGRNTSTRGGDEGRVVEEPEQPNKPSEDWLSLSLDQLLAQPPVSWLVDGLVPMASVTILGGAPAVGKSYLALDLALRVVHGMGGWMGADLYEHGSVIYLALEGTAGLAGRGRAWRKYHEGERQLHELKIVNPLGASADGAPPLTESNRKRTLRQLRRLHRGLGGKLALVIIDTLTLSVEGDENSSEAMRPALRLASQIAAEFGCAVLIIHHIRKESPKDKKEAKAAPALGDLRGSGSLGGNVDQVLLAWRAEMKTTDHDNDLDGARMLRVAKAKDGDDGPPPIRFELDVVPTGVCREDGSGKEEVACVVRHVGMVNRREQAARDKDAQDRDLHDRKERLLAAASKLTNSVNAEELCSRAMLSPGKGLPTNRHLPKLLCEAGKLSSRPLGRGCLYGPREVIEQEEAQAKAEAAAKQAAREGRRKGRQAEAPVAEGEVANP